MVGERRPFERLALRAHPERDADALGGDRQVLVDARRGVGAAGHARDQERRRERLTEELDRRVDRGEVELRERTVLEVEVVEEARLELHAMLERELDVLGLAVALDGGRDRRSSLVVDGGRAGALRGFCHRSGRA